MEKEIEFIIDGQLCGSATLFIENGEVDTTNAEEKFWKAVRFNREKLIEEEREYIIDNLTLSQADKLRVAHAEDYQGTYDDMPDNYERYLESLSLDDLKKILV